MHLAATLLTNLLAKEYVEYEIITDPWVDCVGRGHDVPRVVLLDRRDNRNHDHNTRNHGDATAADDNNNDDASNDGSRRILIKMGRDAALRRPEWPYFCSASAASALCASSSAWLTTGAMAWSCSPSFKLINFTPIVLRPASRTSFTRVRII